MAAFQRIIMFLIAIYAVLAVSAAPLLTVRGDVSRVGPVVIPPDSTQASPSSDGGETADLPALYRKYVAPLSEFTLPYNFESEEGKQKLRTQLHAARAFTSILQNKFLTPRPPIM